MAAVALATLMYGGLVLSQSATEFRGVIPIGYVNEPPDTVVFPLTPDPVLLVRYFAPSGVGRRHEHVPGDDRPVRVEGATGPVKVPIDVTAPADTRIRVLGYDRTSRPSSSTRSCRGPACRSRSSTAAPDGLTLGPVTVDPATVTVSRPESVVDKVVAVRADVVIQASGLDVDEDVELVAVDKLGDALAPLDVTPTTARVSIRVFSDRQTRTLPINAVVTGTPAAGFEIDRLGRSARSRLVDGDADPLER